MDFYRSGFIVPVNSGGPAQEMKSSQLMPFPKLEKHTFNLIVKISKKHIMNQHRKLFMLLNYLTGPLALPFYVYSLYYFLPLEITIKL